MMVESPNVKSIWRTIEIDEEGVETVLIVETDLELNAAHAALMLPRWMPRLKPQRRVSPRPAARFP
jgi:hypothetical protein